METKKYVYPVGDFISGFSTDENNPCDYELECQRMVIRGVEFLDENQLLFEQISEMKLEVYDPLLRPIIDFMCENPDVEDKGYCQTGGMVQITINHAYIAKKNGWDWYISKIQENEEK